jgi:hypothetical protein
MTAAAAAAVLAVGSALFVNAPTANAESAEALAARTIKCQNNKGDSDLINKRIGASKTGDEIIFDGPCLITKTIKLVGDRAYRGESRTGTIIKQADGVNLDAIFASDSYLTNSTTTGLSISLRSMSIEGNREKNPGAHDSVVLRSWQTVLEDVQISDSQRHGIRVTSVSQNGTGLSNTQVNGRIIGNQINNSGGNGLFVEDPGNSVTDWQFKDNYVADTGGDGVRMDNVAGWMITGNHIYGVRGDSALYAERMWGSSIGDNYIEGFQKFGIWVAVQGDPAASTISTNRIFDFDGHSGNGGIFLHIEGRYGRPNVAVTGNAIRGIGQGIGLDYQKGNADTMEIVSNGNSVTDVAIPRQVGPGVTVTTGQFKAEGL